MSKKGFDPECRKLAEYFLPNKPRNEAHVTELAQHIQDSIEDFLWEPEPVAVTDPKEAA